MDRKNDNAFGDGLEPHNFPDNLKIFEKLTSLAEKIALIGADLAMDTGPPQEPLLDVHILKLQSLKSIIIVCHSVCVCVHLKSPLLLRPT